jgi:hypothetical protein
MCNHLRRHRRGEKLRELLVLGLVAMDEVKKDSRLGGEIARKLAKRKAQNLRRRRAAVRDAGRLR